MRTFAHFRLAEIAHRKRLRVLEPNALSEEEWQKRRQERREETWIERLIAMLKDRIHIDAREEKITELHRRIRHFGGIASLIQRTFDIPVEEIQKLSEYTVDKELCHPTHLWAELDPIDTNRLSQNGRYMVRKGWRKSPQYGIRPRSERVHQVVMSYEIGWLVAWTHILEGWLNEWVSDKVLYRYCTYTF
jgi:hypothetical protein